jgi:hypothetical protein
MHFQALKRAAPFLGIDESSYDKELAVSKINIIGAFLHSASTVIVRKVQNPDANQSEELVEIDRKFWKSDQEWYSHRAGLAGRLLCWRAEMPSELILPETPSQIARMDTGSTMMLDRAASLDLQRCYQIALFFWQYLSCISFNTAAPTIRTNLLELQYRLSTMDLHTIKAVNPTTLFGILVAGAHASHSRIERPWFIEQIVQLYPDVQSLDTVWHMHAKFFDPLSSNFKFIEEIWQEVVLARLADCKSAFQVVSEQFVRPIQHSRPTSYTPDMSRPMPVVELREIEAVELERSLHRPARVVRVVS